MWMILCGISFLLCALRTLLKHLNRNYYLLSLNKRVKTLDGTPLKDKVFVMPGKTVFGNNLDILRMTPRMLFKYARGNIAKSAGRSYLLNFIFTPMYNVVQAGDVEDVLQSPKLIAKGVMYELLKPFLGEGLLISADQKWHSRRKMLTPAFHFNVLQDFLDIFKDECRKFIYVLEQNVGNDCDVKKIIPQFTLNNVCETALGVKLDDLIEGDYYRKSIHALESVMIERACNPLLYCLPYFYFFGSYQKHVTNLKIAHDFSSQIIKRKRKLFVTEDREILDDFGRKKRFAMLDTLLRAEQEGLIDHQGICDEVNTFMFEGYDTTSTCLIFTLLMLAVHEDVQERCFEEVQSLPTQDKDLTVFHFNELTFLECVIKETLRLFPSVPFHTRMCVEECVVNGLIMPKGTQINIHSYDIMRDPTHFPNPSKFQPERFLPENTVNRHPFAYIPFSAGQRNCIGQKFAMLEIKALLVSVLRNFKLLPVTQLEDIILEYGLVLRSQKSVKIRFERRKNVMSD